MGLRVRPLLLLLVLFALSNYLGEGLSLQHHEVPSQNVSSNQTAEERAHTELVKQQVALVCSQLKSISDTLPNQYSNASKALKAMTNETCTALNRLSNPNISQAEKREIVRDFMRSRLEWARKLTDIMDKMRKEVEAEANSEAKSQQQIVVTQVLSKLRGRSLPTSPALSTRRDSLGSSRAGV
mmetsp:Transcript_993/g.2175  ORF Transcript_993/g.2175 Transcript_993/m.2175 type:complete len:183 (+) Transcript_993:167-715(+)